ncbi:MAG: methyltransferase [Methanobacteriota archaeon]|nr:MAG: methyltransferase [Euryarchaeota archaeon]
MKLDMAIDIVIDPEVYNPSDDSYLLLKVVDVREGERFLEMGSGSGLIAIHAARAGADVVAADISPHAVECTRRNALRNGVKVEAVRSDLFESIPQSFDVIAFNPPYLAEEKEPKSWIERSWSGGSGGTDVSAAFLEQAPRHLAPNGRVYVILSSLGGLRSLLRTARELYTSTMLEEKHMFFESIFAYKFELLNLASDK